jgi:hypothetical protein
MTAHFNVGDRVRIMDNKQLIEEVRGQLGYVINVDNQDRIFVLIPKTPDWEV